MNPELGCLTKEFELYPTTVVAAAGTTNGAACDIRGLRGRALVLFSADAMSADGTCDADIQEADDSSFTQNVAVVNTYAVGTNTSAATMGISDTNTAVFRVRSVSLEGRRRYLRGRAIVAGTSIAGAITIHMVALGEHNLQSGTTF